MSRSNHDSCGGHWCNIHAPQNGVNVRKSCRLQLTRARQAGAGCPGEAGDDLAQPGSPPAGVCYHYSAQPFIAEAGLAPASMSKVEGCT